MLIFVDFLVYLTSVIYPGECEFVCLSVGTSAEEKNDAAKMLMYLPPCICTD